MQLGSEARNSHLLHVRLRFAGGTVQSPVYPRGQSHLPVACGCQPRSLSAEAQPLINICLPQCLPAQLLVAGATAPSTALLPWLSRTSGWRLCCDLLHACAVCCYQHVLPACDAVGGRVLHAPAPRLGKPQHKRQGTAGEAPFTPRIQRWAETMLPSVRCAIVCTCVPKSQHWHAPHHVILLSKGPNLRLAKQGACRGLAPRLPLIPDHLNCSKAWSCCCQQRRPKERCTACIRSLAGRHR